MGWVRINQVAVWRVLAVSHEGAVGVCLCAWSPLLLGVSVMVAGVWWGGWGSCVVVVVVAVVLTVGRSVGVDWACRVWSLGTVCIECATYNTFGLFG